MNFEAFYREPYSLVKEVLLSAVRPGDRVLDLGCGEIPIARWLEDGRIDCSYWGVDSNRKLASRIARIAWSLRHVKLKIFYSGAEKWRESEKICSDIALGVTRYQEVKFNVVVANASLHEIVRPGDCEHLRKVLEELVETLSRGGHLLIGDHWYPEKLSHDEVEAYRKRVLKQFGHADPRAWFWLPEQIRQVISGLGLVEVSWNDIRSTEEINRRFVVSLWRKQ